MMRSVFRVAAMAAVIALPVACAKQTNGNGQTTVTIDQARVAQVAQGVLKGAEQAAATYMAQATVQASDKAKIQQAEASAEALVKSLPTMTPTDFAQGIQDAETSINAVMASLPASLIPPSASAGLAAFEIMVNAIVPLLQAQNSSPVPAAPVPATVVLRH